MSSSVIFQLYPNIYTATLWWHSCTVDSCSCSTSIIDLFISIVSSLEEVCSRYLAVVCGGNGSSESCSLFTSPSPASAEAECWRISKKSSVMVPAAASSGHHWSGQLQHSGCLQLGSFVCSISKITFNTEMFNSCWRLGWFCEGFDNIQFRNISMQQKHQLLITIIPIRIISIRIKINETVYISSLGCK